MVAKRDSHVVKAWTTSVCGVLRPKWDIYIIPQTLKGHLRRGSKKNLRARGLGGIAMNKISVFCTRHDHCSVELNAIVITYTRSVQD